MKQFKSYFMVDMKLFYREPQVLFFAFLFPVAMYMIFGVMFGDDLYGEQGTSYYDEYTASFMGIILLNIALFNVGPGMVIFKEMGFFKTLKVTPLKPRTIVAVTMTRSFIMFVIGLVEMLIVGYLMFDRMPPQNMLQMFLAVSISAYALFAFGFMTSVFFKSSTAAFGGAVILFQIMLMLSGAGVPLDQYPDAIKTISVLIPMTYVVDVLRMAWQGHLFSDAAIVSVGILAVLGSVFICISSKYFKWYEA